MNTDQDKRIREIFADALEKSDAVERAAHLAQACGNDAQLRQQVEALLQAHEKAGAFLEQPPFAGSGVAPSGDGEQTKPAEVETPNGPGPAIALSTPLTEKPGDKIGRYKLLQQIGEGGCGVVYLAEQEQPIRRRVALKVIKLGMDTKQVVARFEAERQALALMDHPNIAKVLDAGATDTGRPYFVMELVRGIKITDYCDQNNLSTEQRLDLFVRICHAIQHAHQKGVIHRDIKPSNILITINDGVPVPKVIDFGIAKAVGQQLTDKTVFTAFEQFIGTPAYTSPEQALMTSLDVDTRSDIYALGVLLYELLTGHTPFEQKELLDAGLDQMRRMIREQEPMRPSTRLSTLDDPEQTTVAKRRSSELPQLIHLVRGDLDWIVMKCLEKDRTRRYETANGLAHDVLCHLRNEPVAARPPNRLYRFQKLVRRNKLAFAAAGAVAAALVLGALASTWQAVRATRAERVQNRLREAAEAARRQVEARAYASDMNLAARSASSGANLANVQNLLSRWRQTEPDRRGWEWYYLNGLCHRDLLTISADNNELHSVAWSPDGKRLASAGHDGIVKIWDASTGRKIAELRGHADPVRCVAWSPDGSRLASSSFDNTIRVWDADTGRTVFTLTGHSNAVFGVAWSRDGKKLASASQDQTLKVWDATTGAEVLTVPTGLAMEGVSWNADDTRLAACSDNTTTVMDATTGRVLLKVDQGLTMDWSPNGMRLATGGHASRVIIRDVVTGTNSVPLATHGGSVYCVAWSPDGTLLASCSRGDGTVKVWDTQRHTQIRSFRGHEGAVFSVSWRPDGKQVASAGADGMIKVWDVAGGDPSLTTIVQPAQVTSMALDRDWKHLATGDDRGLLRIWDMATREQPIILHRAGPWVFTVAWNPTGTRLASGDNGGRIRLCEANGRELWSVQAYARVQGEATSVRSLAWSPDGKRLVSGGQDGHLKIWDSDTEAMLTSIDSPGSGALTVAWSPDGKQLAVGKGGLETTESQIQILDASSGKLQRVLRGHRELIRSVAWSPNGKLLVSASDDTTIRIWDVEAAREIRKLLGHSNAAKSVAWSPDGMRLASGSWDSTIRIWDPVSGEEVCSFANSGGMVAWSPDGKRIANGDARGRILIHDSAPGMVAEMQRKMAELERRTGGSWNN